jgi:iron complex outermembrane receptor protein
MKPKVLLSGVLLTSMFIVWDQNYALSAEPPEKSVQQSHKVDSLLAQSSTPNAQPANQIVEVTGAKINATATGLDLILETPLGEKLQVSPQPRIEGNTYTIDIPNAQLRLSSDKVFRQEKPATGIAEVIIINQDANSVRVTLIGEARAPKIEISNSDKGLLFGVVSVATSAELPQQPQKPSTEVATSTTQPSTEPTSKTPPEQTSELKESEQDADEVEITVTGDRAIPYRVPNASTGTRTDTPIRDIPQSIQVVPKQVLEDQKIIRLVDALRNVSGVFNSNGFGGTVDNFLIRGFDDAATLQNGFKENASNLSLRDPANIEQIEVLKGPASVLYGNIEPGGVVNVVTKKPLDYPFNGVELSVGSRGFYRSTLDLSGPLTSDKALLYRLNLAYENAGSFRDFVRSERIFAAPVFDFKLGDRTNLSINTSYLYDRRTIDDIPINRFLGEPGDFRRNEQFGIGYRLEHKFDDNLKIRNAFQFSQSNEAVFNTNATELDQATGTLFRDYFDNANRLSQYSMQTDLTSKFKTGSVEHQVLFGFDLQRNISEGFFRTPSDAFDTSAANRQTPSINIFNPIYNQQQPDLSSFIFRRDDRTTTSSLGIFIQDQITLADNLKLLIGGRFDTIRQDLDDRLNSSLSGQSNEAFSPRVGIVYQPIPPISLYASYSRSFNPNTGITAAGSLLEPSRGTQYEAGIRAELNPQIAANLAFYEITKTNIPTTDPIDPAFSIAVGEQRSRGIEFDISGEISPGWNVIASYSYTNAEISQSNDYPVGNKVPNVPLNKASLWTTYELQHGDLKGLGFGMGLFYVDARQGDLENSFELPSYLRTDAAIYYRQNNWRAAINFQNVFNVRYFESTDLGRATVIPGAPFAVIGSFAIQF